MTHPDVKVSFVVGGVQKAGTTALDAYLRQHPALCLPATTKELHFFDSPTYTGDASSLAAYHAKFDCAGAGRVLGEVTPIYTYWSSAPARIHAYNPAMKWVVILRNPVDRAYSQWRMQRARGFEPLEFESAIREEAARCAAAFPHQERRFSYVDRGFYAVQVRRVLNLFGHGNCLFLLFEDLCADPDATLSHVHGFLGIARLPIDPVGYESLAGTEAAIDPTTRRNLAARFAEDIAQTGKLIGRSLAHWLADSGPVGSTTG